MLPDHRYVELVLNLFFESGEDRHPKPDVFTDGEWSKLLALAKRNVILLRSCEFFYKAGICPNLAFREAVSQEKKRICHTVELIAEIGEVCETAGIAFVFTKAFQHYPDMGNDVDLFVLDRTKKIDLLIAKGVCAFPTEGSLINRISGKTGYYVNGHLSPIEIHHGRLGHIGEHNRYPDVLIKNRIHTSIGGITTCIPCREDRFIIQVMQRIYGHMSLRLADVVYSIREIRGDRLDWDYVVDTARKVGLFSGLCYYVNYVNQIHSKVSETDILPPEIKTLLVKDGAPKISFGGSHYHFPVLSVGARVYLKKLFTEIRMLNIESVGRLCLLPLLAVYTGFRCILQRSR